jgi:glyoxylase-like metal-dependent hydrolase (beta-lactamase superfamily II)
MLPGENVEAILITHTHRDHSPAARPLQRLTGAPIIGAAAHHPARPPRTGEQHHLDASADSDHRPDRVLADGDRLAMAGMEIEVIATPGHTMNHLCFALAGRDMLLSGDHVMGWSTSIVAPPDGSMGAYMASLDKLRSRSETRYLPGHGEVLAEAPRFVRGLLAHRRQRETSILSHLRAGLRSTQALVLAMYEGLDPSLRGAAALSVLAHLEDLVERGLVRCEDQPGHGAVFHPR